MTTREVYYKIYSISELPVAVAWFTIKDKNGVIQLGYCQYLCFHDGHEKNIKLMEKVAKRKNFMFWNISDEGIKFFETNAKAIGEVFVKMILNQK
jgi:hypothetical protein